MFPTTIQEGSSITVRGDVSDIGADDTSFTLEINWGDGTAVETISLNAARSPLSDLVPIPTIERLLIPSSFARRIQTELGPRYPAGH